MTKELGVGIIGCGNISTTYFSLSPLFKGLKVLACADINVQAAELREPHRIARYLEELAGAYHRWYDNCRVTPLGEESVTDLHRTRLWLNVATGQVLRNGLGLLGVSAPARM